MASRRVSSDRFGVEPQKAGRSYAGLWGSNDVEVIVVFDGNSRSLKAKVETVSPFFHVVYTPSKMTADSYIEMESYKRRDEYRSIFVVTSDGAEQN